MSDSSVPNKGDIVINPNTQRPIRVGGRSWLKLVKEGLISGHYKDPRKLARIGDNPNKQIEEINKTLPRGVQAVRGRGIYKDHLTTRKVKPDTEDVTKYTAKMATRIVKENIETLNECDDVERELEKMILEEMAYGRKNNENNKIKNKIGRPKKVKFEEEKYKLEQAPQYDDDDDDDDNENFFGDGDIDYFSDE